MKFLLSTFLFFALSLNANALIVNGQLKGAIAEKLATDPTGTGAVEGRIFYNTANKKLKVHNGTTWTESGSGGGGAFKNYLTNPGFESGTSGWTASAGAFVATTTAANKFAETYSGSWTPAAGADTLINTAFAITSGGGPTGNGAVTCMVKTAGAHVMSVLDGSNVLNTVTISGAAAFVPVVMNFIYPTSSSGINLKFTAADTSPIYIDECFLGDARAVNLSNVNQATLYGSLEWTKAASCDWTSASGTYGDFTADSDCVVGTVTGEASSPATKVPGIKFASLPPGNYHIVVTGGMVPSSTDGSCEFRIYDGTTAYGFSTSVRTGSPTDFALGGSIISDFTVSTSRSNVTFQIQAMQATQTPSCVVSSSSGSTIPLKLSLYRFPLSSEQAITPSTQPAFAGAKIATDAAHGFSTTSSTYVKLTDSDIVAGDKTLYGTGAVTTAAGDYGVKLGNLPPGSYLVTFTGTFASIFSSTATFCSWGISDDGGSTVAVATGTYASAAADTGQQFSAVFSYSAVQSNKEFVAYVKRALGDGTCDWNVDISPVTVTVLPLSQSLPLPIVQNQVFTPHSGRIAMVSALVSGATGSDKCSSTPCTLYSDLSGGNLSVTRSSAGTYVASTGSYFSSGILHCFCTADGPGAYSSGICGGYSTSANSFALFTSDVAAPGTPADARMSIMCMGQK